MTNNAAFAVICLFGLFLAAAGDSHKPASMYVRHVVIRERIPVAGSDVAYAVVVATVSFAHSPEDFRILSPLAKQQLNDIQARQFELTKGLLFHKLNEDKVSEKLLVRTMMKKPADNNKMSNSKVFIPLKAFFSNMATYFKEYILVMYVLAAAVGLGFVLFLKFRTA